MNISEFFVRAFPTIRHLLVSQTKLCFSLPSENDIKEGHGRNLVGKYDNIMILFEVYEFD